MTIAIMIAALGAAQPTPVTGTIVAPHQITGIAQGAKAPGAILHLRDGRTIRIDTTAALRAHRAAVIVDGQAYRAMGAFDRAGVFEAQVVTRAKLSPDLWSPNR